MTGGAVRSTPGTVSLTLWWWGGGAERGGGMTTRRDSWRRSGGRNSSLSSRYSLLHTAREGGGLRGRRLEERWRKEQFTQLQVPSASHRKWGGGLRRGMWLLEEKRREEQFTQLQVQSIKGPFPPCESASESEKRSNDKQKSSKNKNAFQ